MHESIDKNGVMTMQPIKGVDIPAQGKVTFAPGGKHLMIWGINAAAKTQGKLPFTFIFSNGERIIYEAVLRQPGDAAGAPASKDEQRPEERRVGKEWVGTCRTRGWR